MYIHKLYFEIQFNSPITDVVKLKNSWHFVQWIVTC